MVEYYYLLGLLLAFGAVIARIAMARVASASAVDQHYWLLAAKAYREQSGLPVRISGKYLMESDEQAYPPLFGMLLGRVLNDFWVRHATLVVESTECCVLAGVMLILGLPMPAMVVALGFYVSAPILVVYNAQLTPRILGDFFLFSAMACQVVATFGTFPDVVGWFLWGTSILMLALMFMTHKMTYQLHLVLLPFWAWALQSWFALLATLCGLLLYLALVGPRFAVLQLRAHWDIVRFWNRHWKDLQAHQFLDSPIYGKADRSSLTRFHVPGWRGMLKHVRTVVSYAPVAIVLPIVSLISGAWPPDWVLVWFCVTYLWVLCTLFISPLKCLGGGHLYVFNAVIPSVLYVAYLPLNPSVLISLVGAAALTGVSLLLGCRTVASRPTSRGSDFDEVLSYLSTLSKSQVAVFPLQAAEPVAAQTNHAVLWGGHGFGFENMDGFFPVLKNPLGYFFNKYSVEWVLWDSLYWPEGMRAMSSEGVLDVKKVTRIGKWALAPLNIKGN